MSAWDEPAPWSRSNARSAFPRGVVARWVVLGDPDGPIDLTRLFPEVEIRLEQRSEAFAAALALGEPNLIVLMAPPAGPADLQQVAAWTRNHPSARAVLLSRHDAVAVRLHALELGLDDAIDLSADPMEVVGRLSIAGHHAASPYAASRGRIGIGEGIALDLAARALWRDGLRIALRPKEFDLLAFLATHPGRAFTRQELLHRVWRGSDSHERVVDVHVFWLRSKVERDPRAPRHLVTVRGSGYRFDPPQPAEPTLQLPAAGASTVNRSPIPR